MDLHEPAVVLTLLHSERPKLYTVLVFLSAIGLNWNSVTYFSVIFNSLTTKKQMTKFLSANFSKNVKSKLYHIENSKTKGQTV